MAGDSKDLARRAFEALVADEYRHQRIGKADLMRPLGLETTLQIDGFLKAHGVYDAYTLQEFDEELEHFRRLVP